MSSSYGENIRLTIFGQSHSPAIGMTIEGIPAGKHIDLDALGRFLERRAPGRTKYSTMRREGDVPEFLSGIVDGVTCGVPLTAIIRNGDTRSKDYENLRRVPRPGHADFTANEKYFGSQDYAGGGHFSGRLTAPLCIAGGICLQLLAEHGISVFARILSLGGIRDGGELTAPLDGKEIPVVDDEKGALMLEKIYEAKVRGDSVGGIIECVVTGVPTGLGDPIFGGIENRISQIIFGIPAVKGIEFGAGFAVAEMTGSTCNDPFCIRDGHVATETNNCGGILGGITDGMPILFRAAFKPTSSIYLPQRSVNIETLEETPLQIRGRHDPCIVLRAVPCVEAAAAIAIYDAFLSRKRELP